MGWYLMGPVGATRDLWVAITGPTRPTLGAWRTPLGQVVHHALGIEGPPAVRDVEWYFMPVQGHRGRRLGDALWQYGEALNVYSERMCAVLESCGARLQTWPADVRLRDGSPIEGYLSVLEETNAAGPVHSMFRGRRAGRVVINEQVRDSLNDAGMTGLEFTAIDHAFPGDNKHQGK